MSDFVAVLQRWTDAGAIWRVISRGPDSVTVGLYTCDGGEEVDQFTSVDPALLRYVDAHEATSGRSSSEGRRFLGPVL